jgi:hypothetical protein
MIRHAFLLAVLMMPAVARAECVREDRDALTRRGYSPAQIEAWCDLDQQPFDPSEDATATYCDTAYGFCPLSAPEPAGGECTCSTPSGPVSGVAE